MSLTPDPSSPVAPKVRSTRSRLVAITLAHATVDFFSFIAIPLMTVLKGKLDISDRNAAVLIAIGAVTSGLIQPGVAWLSDRFDTRILGTLGALIGVISVGCVGFASSFEVLVLLQILSAAGIGAFHPVAAAAMGHLSGPHRSFGLSVFYCAGMAGGVLGNIISPLYVKKFGGGVAVDGLPALAWLIAPGVVCVLLLALAIHSVAHRHTNAHAEHAALSDTQRRRRWFAVSQLYLANVIRFGVDSAIVVLIIRWTETLALARPGGAATLDEAARTYAAGLNGPLQASKQIGMGVGSLVLGWMIRRGGANERRAMIAVPLLALVTIPLVPHTSPAAAFALIVLAGLGYGSLVAPTIAMAQRLLPHRTTLASSLMMGGAWAVGSVLAPLSDKLTDVAGLNTSFAVIGGLCLVSSILAATLPSDVK